MLISILGFAYLKQKGLLLPDVNGFLQWLVIYPFCMFGSIAPDLDQPWDSCPSKDYPSWFVNKALHLSEPMVKVLNHFIPESKRDKSLLYKLTNLFYAKHRSWQTHSDFMLLLIFFLMYKVINLNIFTNIVEVSILRLIFIGFGFGVVAHLLLDLLTPDGIWCFLLVFANFIATKINPKYKIKTKISFVPYTRSKMFGTGGKWESFICLLLKLGTFVSCIWFLLQMLYPYLPWEIVFP